MKPADKGEQHELALPAYDQCIKASHVFNLLDARGVISVTERQAYILRVRELAKGCCEAWARRRERRRALMPELLLELFSEEIPARMQAQAAEDLERSSPTRWSKRASSMKARRPMPRRAVLCFRSKACRAKAADVSEERKGPRVDAPEPPSRAS